MPVSLYHFGAQALGEQAGSADLFTFGAQVGTLEFYPAHIYRFGVQAAYTPPDNLNLYHLGTQVAYRVYADEDDDVVYYDIIFPECISYGSTGVPRYLTDKAEVLSGDEQRNSRYRYPRHEYSINMENLPQAEIAEVMNLWHIVKGDMNAFLFLDPLDHTSGNTETNLSPTEVTPLDQICEEIAPGEFHLLKTYTKGARQQSRRIKYPKEATLRVAVDGTEAFNWTYNMDTGVLSFTASLSAGTAQTVTKVGNTLTAEDGPIFA